MSTIFADTAGWGHLLDSSQAHHDVAARLYRATRQQGDKLVTTSYILAELVALLTHPLRVPRATLIEFVHGIKSSPFVEIAHIDVALDASAWTLLTQRPDKAWSLVDCASFIVMRDRGLTEALTTDHHFEQAGFRRLLK